MGYGLELAWNNYMLDGDFVPSVVNEQTVFNSHTTLGLPPLAKSKFVTTFINVPLMFKFKPQRNISLGFGGYAGYKVYSYTKVRYGKDGNDIKDRQRNSLNLTDLQYGARVEVGFKDFDLFYNYNFSPLFKTDRGPVLSPFSFGIQL